MYVKWQTIGYKINYALLIICPKFMVVIFSRILEFRDGRYGICQGPSYIVTLYRVLSVLRLFHYQCRLESGGKLGVNIVGKFSRLAFTFHVAEIFIFQNSSRKKTFSKSDST